jgi:hypothetical protein
MGFKSGHTEIGKADSRLSLPSLSREDCILLLNIIKKTSFTGEEMEQIYNITLKIQNIYLVLEKLEE